MKNDVRGLILACKHNRLDNLLYLLSKYHYNVAQKTEACLHSIKHGHIHITEVLFKNDKQIRNKGLLWATKLARVDLLELAIRCGADINASFSNRVTALMIASLDGHLPIIALLLKHGADIHATDANGYTALLMAATREHHDAMRMMLDADEARDNRVWSSITLSRY